MDWAVKVSPAKPVTHKLHTLAPGAPAHTPTNTHPTVNNLPIPTFTYSQTPVLTPQPDSSWADTMVLNPTVIAAGEMLHMLFRATGPSPENQQPGKPLPYPIFLGYANSTDGGETWNPDYTRPCLAPALATERESLQITSATGKSVINYANGCIEDPRLFYLNNECYATVACRLFAPGPYWEKDDPMQCAPQWATDATHGLGRAATENLTVSVLFKVNLSALAAGSYEDAFSYACHLSNPESGDNRDVVVLPEQIEIGGKLRYAQLHRPKESAAYTGTELSPSIFIAAADSLEALASAEAEHRLLASPLFEWEGDRIGASWTPIAISNGDWLLPYHGKQDAEVGYTQSFMILSPGADGWPRVAHRCPTRLMYAQQHWELNGLFKTPCLFTCGGIVRDGRLIMPYGAADTASGIATVDFAALVAYVKQFDASGNRIN